MLKRGFIRGLWGIHDNSHRILARRFRTDKDIKRIMDCKYNSPFLTYVYGKENYMALKSLGIECKLLIDEPQAFDLVKYQFRNKMEMIKHAFDNDGYDELVYMDWDCVPQKQIPNDFWDRLNEKDSFQACLQLYHRRKCHWRPLDLRKVPNGGFIYLRDPKLVYRAIELWDATGKNDSDEIAWAKMTDELTDGWKGMEEYWKRFEPEFCNLHRASSYGDRAFKDKKDICFIHYQG